LSIKRLGGIRQHMKDIKEFISKHDIFAIHCDIHVLEVSPGEATARMVVQDKHLNGLKLAHGGAIFALADLAFAAAANSRDHVAVGINATISYIRPAGMGDILYARAREIFSNRTLSGYTVDVENQAGDLIATFQGTAYKKGSIQSHKRKAENVHSSDCH